MMGFGNFWDKFSANTSNLDDILKRDDATIGELLDDDNVISELKNLNPRLLNYLTSERIKELVRFTIEEPPNGDDKNRAYKYPFVASELLICESSTILDAFFVKQKQAQDDGSLHLDSDDGGSEKAAPLKTKYKEDDFADFKESSKPADEEANEGEKPEASKEKESEAEPSKIEEEPKEEAKEEAKEEPKEPENKAEDERSSEQGQEDKAEGADTMLIDYLFSFIEQKGEINMTLAGYFNKILNSFFNKRQAEVVGYIFKSKTAVGNLIHHIKLRSITEVLLKLLTFENNQLDKYLPERKNVLSELINRLSKEADPDALSNIQLILNDILMKSHMFVAGRELVEFLFTEPIIEPLIKCLFSESNPLLFAVTSVFSQYILFINNENKKDKEDEEEQGQVKVEINFESLYKEFAAHIPELIERLKKKNSEKLNTTFGDQITILGTGRMKLIEILGALIRLEKPSINEALAKGRFLNLLMEFFVEYEWNNMLHLQAEKIFTYVLDSESELLRKELLEKDAFLKFLSEAAKKTTYEFVNNKKRRTKCGYLGHLNKICNNFIKIAEKREDLKPLLESDYIKDLKTNYLDNANEGESRDLGGYNRNSSTNHDDSSIEFDKDTVVEKNKEFLEAKQDSKDFEVATTAVWQNSGESHANKDSWSDPFKDFDQSNQSGAQMGFNASGGDWKWREEESKNAAKEENNEGEENAEERKADEPKAEATNSLVVEKSEGEKAEAEEASAGGSQETPQELPKNSEESEPHSIKEALDEDSTLKKQPVAEKQKEKENEKENEKEKEKENEKEAAAGQKDEQAVVLTE